MPQNDEGELLKALAKQPVSVAKQTFERDFQHYKRVNIFNIYKL